MKTIKNNTLKLVVMMSLLCGSVYADGDMGSGGRTCPNGQETCLTGDMGSGGVTSYDGPVKSARTPDGDMGSGGRGYLDWMLEPIYTYFDWTM